MDESTVRSRRNQLDERGYALLPRSEFEFDVGELRRMVESLAQAGAGIRRLLDVPWCAELGERVRLHPVLQAALAPSRGAGPMHVIRKVRHQELACGPAPGLEHPGRRKNRGARMHPGWSEKAGEVFVQPPVSVLEQLVAVRLHVDDCDQGNGALRVVPGSHRLGRLSAAEGASARSELGEQTVRARAGDTLVMKPLLLHASSKAANRCESVTEAGTALRVWSTGPL